MKQIGKVESIGQVVVLCIISIVVLLVTWIRIGIVMATQSENEEEITTQIDQSVEKYFNLEDNQVLLQQKIVVNTNNNVKKEMENLYINVPIIQDKKPETVNVLVDGELVEDQFCHYDAKKNQLKIEMNQNVSVYKMIYGYQGITAEQQEVELYTKAYTKFENAEEVETEDERTVEINTRGEKISIEGEISKEVYKGYFYEAKENKTNYEENYIIEVSNTQNVEDMNVTKEREVFTYEIEEEAEKTKIEKDTNDSVYYTKTTINKEQMLTILGEEGKIVIQDEQEKMIQELTKDSQEDENGNMVVDYGENGVKNIKIAITKPVQLGEIKLYNQKAIHADIGYAKEEIKKFQNLESIIRVNESTNTLQMNLLNTKSEAMLDMDQTELSTLQKNENVQMMVTLSGNTNQYDLYKNPVIDIVFPKELEIAIKNITQLNFEDIIQIKSAEIEEGSEGEKILRIALEGEQQNYSNQLSDGIQIALIGDITIGNTVPSKEETIEVFCRNENTVGEESKTQCSIKINSKYGVLMVNRVENYSETQSSIETIDDKDINIVLEPSSEERIATQITQIINNYENPISEVSIMGNIIEDEQAVDMSFQEIILPEDKNARIYYSDAIQTNENNIQWTENIEELENVKSYKIVLEDEIQPEERLGITYLLDIPEDLNPESNSYVTNTLAYENLDNTETTISNMKFTTKNQQVQMFSTAKTFEKNGIKAEISAISGNQCLQDGDAVKEGQGIRYKIRVTNTSQRDLSNIVLEAINTNAIYYDTIAYEADANGITVTKVKIDENESLTSKILNIESLQIGEVKEVSYQISVKEVADDNQTLTGEIKITADDYEEVMQNITNPIEQSSIKATLRYLYSEGEQLYEGASVAFSANVKNISNEELQDVIVEIPVAEGFEFSTEDLFIEDGATYEFLEYKDRILKFKIPKIAVQETIKMNVRLYVEKIEINKAEEIISQYFKVLHQDIEYVSNDVERKVEQSNTEIIANQTTNRQEKIVKDGDSIQFFFTIENKGVIEADVVITDEIPEGLQINFVKLRTSDKEEELEYAKNGLITKEINIKPNELIEIEIDTTVNQEAMFHKEIENYIEIEGINIYVESNKINFLIESDYENNDDLDQTEPDEIIDVDVDIDDEYKKDPSTGEEDNNNKDDQNPSEDKNNDNNSNNNSSIENGSCIISGTVWLDRNANGQREREEDVISNMPVILINEETGTELSERTKQDGSYSFGNLKQGKYIVIFQYNTNQYTVTTYQKEGVAQNINSDVIYSVMKIQNREIPVAKTKMLEINSRNLENIDAGFVEGKKFDLKLDKSVSQITIQNSTGTKVNNYQQSKLAKIEIDAKQIETSNLIIKYNIAVTNQGEVAGYANEIIDELPSDLTFSQQMNPTWYPLKDGSIATKELSNQMIQPGETKNITLTVSKKMTQENTGTITNKAKIEKYSSDSVAEDVDSSNNESQVDVIVSVRTGRIILYLSLATIIIMIIAIGVYYIKKEVLPERR